MKVVKVTDPASDPQDFDFDLTGPGVPADLDLDTDAGNATLPVAGTFSLNASQLGAQHGHGVRGRGLEPDALECTGGGARLLDEPGRPRGDPGHRCGRDGGLHVHEHQGCVVDGREGDRSGV